MSTIAERVGEIVAPLLAELGLELDDLEHTGGTLRVTVDREGGASIDAIAAATRAISRALDEADPIPDHYTLEVSTPGLERALRTPVHFAKAVGKTVTVKTVPGTEGERRLAGVLIDAADDTITVRLDADAGERTLSYADIERARTTFAWGPGPKPGKAPATPKQTRLNA